MIFDIFRYLITTLEKSLFTRSTSSPYTIQDINVSGIVKDSCRIMNMVSHKTLHMTLYFKGNCHVEMP